jgi:PAS domain S-box-containing protein
MYVNGTVARHGKKTKEELIGKTMTECYPGIEKTEMFALCKKAMDENQSSKMFNEFVYPDGSHGWFELVIHPAKNGILILSLDVTSRKHIEDELKEKIREVQVLLGSTTDREIRIVELRQEIETLKLIANKEESAAE